MKKDLTRMNRLPKSERSIQSPASHNGWAGCGRSLHHNHRTTQQNSAQLPQSIHSDAVKYQEEEMDMGARRKPTLHNGRAGCGRSLHHNKPTTQHPAQKRTASAIDSQRRRPAPRTPGQELNMEACRDLLPTTRSTAVLCPSNRASAKRAPGTWPRALKRATHVRK